MQANSSSTNTSDCFDRDCAVNPDPMQDNAAYTLFAPGQSSYPIDYMPGWDIKYPASQIPWEPNPGAPACLTEGNCGIYNFQEWVDWIQTNIIEGIYCAMRLRSCQIQVGSKILGIGAAISDCLGMSATKNTIVYDVTNKRATAGTVISDIFNCESGIFQSSAYTCIGLANAGDPPPEMILGRVEGTVKQPRWFKVSNGGITAMNYRFPDSDSSNVHNNVDGGTRLVPIGAIDPDFTTNINEGNGYNSSTGVITIGKEGFYRLTFTSFVRFSYTSKASTILYLMGGLYIDTTVGKTIGRQEKRLFQQPYHRDKGTIVATAVKFTFADYLKVGAKLTPRIWFGSLDSDNVNFDLNTEAVSGRMSLERITQHKKTAA